METLEDAKKGIYQVGSLFLLVATIALIILIILGIGASRQRADIYDNVITVSGTGEVYASPDIAEFVFTVQEESLEVGAIETMVSESVNGIIDELADLDIAEEDIQTTSTNLYPRYEWRRDAACFDNCSNERVLVGYEFSQTVSVKVRDLDSSGQILRILTEAGVDNLSGPNFRIEDPDDAKAEAREQAIEKAREKAEAMAKSLGVRLGKVVNFSEGGYGYPEPYAMAYDEDVMYAKGANAVAESAPVARISEGEERVTSSVTITYKIK